MVPWWRSFAIRFVALYSVVSLAVIVTGLVWLHEIQKREVIGKFGLALESIAGTASPFIAGEDIDAIHGNDDVRGEAFAHVRAVLGRIGDENALPNDAIYVLRPSGDHYEFVVMLQDRTFVGDRYEPPPRLRDLYRWCESRADTVRTELYEDAHGAFISGIAPIRRKDGAVAALLQIDYGIGVYMREVDQQLNTLLVGAVMLTLLFVIVGVWIHRVLKANVMALLGGTDAIQREQYDHIVIARARDELGIVADALNQTLRRLKERFEMLKFLPQHTARMIEAAARAGGVQRAHAELVRATVFESDIRGFTKLSQTLRPEAVVGMLNDYIRVQAEIIEAAGGSIDKFMGDAVLAIFQGESMERRALECAIAIQDAVSRMNDAGAFAVPIHIGIGITVGELVMGNMGSDTRMEHTVIGSTVNLAARLCSAAGPSEIVIAQDLKDALGDTAGFRLGAPEELSVKGFDRPIRCYRASATTIA
jgi:class 3 adenylate cyclase